MPEKTALQFYKTIKGSEVWLTIKTLFWKTSFKVRECKKSFVAKLQNLYSFLKNLTGFVRNTDNIIEVLYKTGKVLQFCYETSFCTPEL